MLASNVSSFATGEISFAFRPTKPHHFAPGCGCGNSDCDIWPSILREKPTDIHAKIMDRQDKTLVVDSSKEPWWVRTRSSELEKSGVKVIKLIVWKSPIEIIDSFAKRGKRDKWAKHWVNYHRNIFSLGNDWHSIPYHLLAKNPSLIVDLLDYENLPSRDRQYEYWTHESHPVFGNDTAIFHLHEEKSRTAECIGVTSVTLPTTPSDPTIRSESETPSLKPLLMMIFFESLDWDIDLILASFTLCSGIR